MGPLVPCSFAGEVLKSFYDFNSEKGTGKYTEKKQQRSKSQLYPTHLKSDLLTEPINPFVRQTLGLLTSLNIFVGLV